MGNDVLSCLNNDVKMIVYKIVFYDAYKRVKEDFNEHFVRIWDDVKLWYCRGYRPIALWRSWNKNERKMQSNYIYDDIWIAARGKCTPRHEHMKLHKDYYYRECFY